MVTLTHSICYKLYIDLEQSIQSAFEYNYVLYMEDDVLCVAANLEDEKDYNTKTATNVAPLYRHARDVTFLSTVHIIKKSLEVPQDNMTLDFNTF